jgi:hypothetical protein
MALADTPTDTSSAAPSPAAAPTAAVATAAPAGTPAAVPAALDQREKLLRAKGYRLETRNGEKLYCRTEAVLGSRLPGRKVCGTAEEFEERERASRDMVEKAQRTQASPTGK